MLVLSPPTMQSWTIRAGDTNVYFLSGTFAATTPTNDVAKGFDDARARPTWSGTLQLPKMKISVSK
jgi:hypothetical protein